jgi:hypothetical protein
VLATVLAGGVPSGLASADSFTPVRMTITVTPIARLHVPLEVTVQVSADPSALDNRTAPLRAHVKLAAECSTYQSTEGVALLDKRLSTQPTTGQAYSGLARGSGRPRLYGVQTLCVWLDEEGDGRTFASDQSIQVNVSAACTHAADRYDALRRQRPKRGVAAKRRRQHALAGARHAARQNCGPGVPL